MKESYAKELTRNDLGLTGSHQAGICVPRKDKGLMGFFPHLNAKEFNPDVWIQCVDAKGKNWKMRYVYYNGKIHGVNTRNEYRITYMTKFFRVWGAVEGCSVVFTATDDPNKFFIQIEKSRHLMGNQDGDRLKDKVSKVVLTAWRKVH